MLSKPTKVAFPSSKHTSKEILDLVIDNEEKEALKVDSGSLVISKAIYQPSGEQGQTKSPSTYVKRPRWFSQTLRDAQEHVETPRSTFRESRPLKKFPDYMELMRNTINFKPSNF
jgi:hypothetical protein